MVTAPLSASAYAMARVPAANFSNSNTPMGPFHTTVPAPWMAAVKDSMVLGPMSIPIGAVPISFTNLVIYLTVYLLGAKKGCISYLIYMLLGVVGLPVFSGYTGGIAKLAGPTGGYLVGFILLALISGIVLEKTNRNIVWSFVGMVAGTAIAYLFGTVWFVIQAQCTVGYALSVCVMPFIPFDLLKMVIAIALGKVVFIALKRSSLLPA